MKKQIKQEDKNLQVFRLDPSLRLCPNFDKASMALYPLPESAKMGFVVMDNFPEEHIQ